MTNTEKRNLERAKMLKKITDFLYSEGEEICVVKSNTIAIPFVNEDGDDAWYEISVKIPKGSKDEAYDGYSLAESYKLETEEKEKAKAERLAKKEAKIAKDKERRERAAAEKEKRLTEKGETLREMAKGE